MAGKAMDVAPEMLISDDMQMGAITASTPSSDAAVELLDLPAATS